jgi:hypothetical protein
MHTGNRRLSVSFGVSCNATSMPSFVIDPSWVWRWEDDPQAPKVFAICRELLSGNTTAAEAARALHDTLCTMWNAYGDYGYKDFKVFEELYSATAHFPMGPVRQRW